MLDARIVAASTQGFAPAAHSESARVDRIAPSAHGVALGFAMRTPIVETEQLHESPPIRGYSPDAGKFPQMADRQVGPEDSNLQPDRYERATFPGQFGKIRCLDHPKLVGYFKSSLPLGQSTTGQV